MKRKCLLNPRFGFTIIEILIFAALFVIAGVAFATILVTFSRIEARQSSVAEVTGQSQFLIQQIQQHVESASLIDIPADVATSTLVLRMSSSSQEPSIIFLDPVTGIVNLQIPPGTISPLTSSKVKVSNLAFVRRINAPGRDSVSVQFTVTFNTSNIQKQFAQTFDTAFSRAVAATFDSGIYPATTSVSSANKLGTSGSPWYSINDVIYFASSSIGINNVNPTFAIDVFGGYINSSQGLCITGICKTDWAQVSGATPQAVPYLRFTRSTVAANASDVSKDGKCNGDFGANYAAATILDVGALSSGVSLHSSLNYRFSVADDSVSFQWDQGTSDPQITTSASTNIPVACVYKYAPVRFTRGSVTWNSAVPTMDSACTGEFGPNYQSAGAGDVANFFQIVNNRTTFFIGNDSAGQGGAASAFYISLAGKGPFIDYRTTGGATAGPLACIHK